MADAMDAATKPHLLAIDVAKQWNAALIELAHGQQRRFKMANSAQDFERLIPFIQSPPGSFALSSSPFTAPATR